MKNKDTELGKATIFGWAIIVSFGITIAIGYHTSGNPTVDNLAVGVAFYSIARAVIAIIINDGIRNRDVMLDITEPDKIQPGELVYGCPRCGQNPRLTPYHKDAICKDCAGE